MKDQIFILAKRLSPFDSLKRIEEAWTVETNQKLQMLESPMSFSSSVTVVETSLLSLLDYDTQLWPLAAISKAKWELWAPSCQSQSVSNQGCCKLDPKTRMKKQMNSVEDEQSLKQCKRTSCLRRHELKKKKKSRIISSLFVSGN